MPELRRIPGYPRYLAGSDGKIYSTFTRGGHRSSYPRLLKSRLRYGRPYLALRVRGKVVSRFAHCLVALAFIGPVPRGKEVNHIDGVPTNARPENLEYLTRSENIRHSIRIGIKPIPRGVANGRAVLTDSDVVRIRERIRALRAGRSMMPRGSLKQLAAEYGVTTAALSQLAARLSWRHVP